MPARRFRTARRRVGGQGRKVAGRQLDHLFVLAPMVTSLGEKGRGGDAEAQIPEATGEFQRPGPPRERLIELTELRVDACHERVESAASTVVIEALREGLSLTQALQPPAPASKPARTTPSSRRISKACPSV